jgi:sugar lactone lactonase YvrE
MADAAGNVFIVDKDSHSVLKVTRDGRIHTVAGTHVEGDGGNGSAPGTSTQLSFPNGLFVRADGTVYVLDTGNGKVRRLDTNGLMTTLFTVSGGITGGRGLWVSDDEALTYFSSGTDLRKRVPGNITTLNNNFNDLGNIALTPDGNILATDRGDNKVFLVDATGGSQGGRTRLFGDGTTNAVVSGTLAFTNGLYEVRGVWPVPNGGYLLATHAGSQVLYVDPAGIVYVFVAGQNGGAHSGDGSWFHAPGLKVTEVRSVAMDYEGNILIVENDFGYVRRIQFRRLFP